MRASPMVFLAPALLSAAIALVGCYDWGGPDDDTAPDDDAGGDDSGEEDDDSGSADDDAADDDSDGDDDDATPPEGLACLPASQSLANTWGNEVQVQLSAEVFDEDGDGVPAEGVVWSVVQGGGQVDSDGLYTSFGDHGGQVLVQAQVLSETSYCEILIEIEASENVSGDPDLPAAAAGAQVVADDSCAATFTYPIDGSAMPGSFPPPLIQWNAGGAGAHVLTIASDWTTVTVFTFQDHWQVEAAYWESLTTLDPGTTLTMTLASGDWNGSSFAGDLCTAEAALVMDVVDGSLDGTIIYWEPPILGQGLKRIDFGSTTAYDFPVTGPIGCVGCHGVNLANPNRIAMADQMSTISVVDATDPTVPIVQGSMARMGAAAGLNPDGDRMVRSAMLVFSGSELILDDVSAGGVPIGPVPTQGAGQAFPSWSPDGGTLVYGACADQATEYGATSCSLRAVESLPGDQWGTDWLIVQAAGDENLYYPAISPDSQWVLYNRAVGPASANSSYDNPQGELWLTDIQGLSQPIMLANATAEGLKNSWPKFAPSTPGDYLWFAFSTTRPYGNLTQATSQIWLAALDMDLAAAGEDPSFAPVWLPGQNLQAGNYIPVWIPRYTP